MVSSSQVCQKHCSQKLLLSEQWGEDLQKNNIKEVKPTWLTAFPVEGKGAVLHLNASSWKFTEEKQNHCDGFLRFQKVWDPPVYTTWRIGRDFLFSFSFLSGKLQNRTNISWRSTKIMTDVTDLLLWSWVTIIFMCWGKNWSLTHVWC